MYNKQRIIVNGALGKMGRTTCLAIVKEFSLELVGVVDVAANDETLFDIVSNAHKDLPLYSDLSSCLQAVEADTMVDFTNPTSVFKNAGLALDAKLNCLIGTTGLTNSEMEELKKKALAQERSIAVVPNFALGAVLMMKFAAEAASFFPNMEIIELHHDQKMDAPSGTALKTAESIAKARTVPPSKLLQEFEKIPGARGGVSQEVHIHSVRLPGLIAHQEVIAGGQGETLTIRHDSYDRISFMPGVMLALRHLREQTGLLFGLDKFLQ